MSEAKLSSAFKVLVLVGLLTSIAGCGRPKPGDDAPFLAAFNLNAPIMINVSLQQPVDPQGNLGNTDDAAVIAFLVNNNVLKIEPNANAAPYWTFIAISGTTNNNVLTTLAAKRVVTGRTNEQSWSEGSIDYYAETINYSVQPSGMFSTMSGLSPTVGSIRLVVQKDPAVGMWRTWYDPTRGTTSTTDQDGPAFIRQLVTVGAGFEGNLGNSIQTARAQAFDQIEKSLADQGLFSRTSAGVVLSRNNGLAFYTIPDDVRGGTYSDANTYCGGVSGGGYHWRLPTLNELGILVGSNTHIIDVPDGRLWSSITQSNPGQAVLLVANTFVVNNGPELTMDAVNPADPNQYAFAQFLQINNDHSTFTYANPVDVRNVPGAVMGGDPGYLTRVICVASVPH